MINVNDDNYKVGFVGVIDILGFSDYTNDETHFEKIKELMMNIFSIKNIYERNLEHIKISILSDTIVILIEANDLSKYDQAFFESVISNIGYIRNEILRIIDLYSRGGITFGKYYYNEKTNVIFGPAITRAAKLTEQSSNFISSNEDERFKNRPAAILLDEVFSEQKKNPYYELFLNGDIFGKLHNRRFKKIRNTDFYIYNPYFDAFQDYKIYSRNEENRDDDTRYKDFYFGEKERLKRHILEAKDNKTIGKYVIEEELLEEFDSNYNSNKKL